MPSISHRAAQAYRSPIRELEDLSEAAKAAGKHVFHLNIGQPDVKTPAAAWRSLEAFPDEVLAYGPARGLESYRQALVAYYAGWGVDLTVADINVTTGASEAIWLTLNAIADPGDEVLVPEPFYALYNGFLELASVGVVPVTTTLAEEFQLPSPTQIAAALTQKTRAILLCNPSNPTGQVYEPTALQAIGRLAEQHDLFVIVDEVYREFVYDNVPYQSALAIPELAQRAIVIDSVSKRYSACGARIGSIACRNQELMLAITRLGRFRLCPPTLGQHLSEAILREEHTYIEEVRAEYDRRRQLLFDGLRAMPGVTCFLPRGAFYCFAELPIDDSERFARWLLTDFDRDGQTVMLAPGAGFYANTALGKRQVRLAYVLNEKDLLQALTCIAKALEVYPGRVVVSAPPAAALTRA